MYDGARVQPEDTPQTLGMDDGDAIDVVIEVRARCGVPGGLNCHAC